jgi:hypothetical protein
MSSGSARLHAFSELRTSAILSTLDKLGDRIEERFPGSGLRQVASELRSVGDDVVAMTTRLRRPFWPARLASVFAGIALIGVTVVFVVKAATLDAGVNRQLDFLQITETGVNEVVLLTVAMLFLARLEGRWKRRLALGSLHRLRSVAHIVDMHQLTKDPTSLLSSASVPTGSSPPRKMTAYELTRYLDYCSELLAITSKLAAVHAEGLDDPSVLAAVNDVESLTQGLSSKIWQKIMILDLASD